MGLIISKKLTCVLSEVKNSLLSCYIRSKYGFIGVGDLNEVTMLESTYYCVEVFLWVDDVQGLRSIWMFNRLENLFK